MELEEGKRIIDKVEKGFELVAKARNLQLHLKDTSLRDHTAHSIFNTLVRQSYYRDKLHEFFTLTKLDMEKDYAFLKLAIE